MRDWEYVAPPWPQNQPSPPLIELTMHTRRRVTIDLSQPELVRPEFGPATKVRAILERYGALAPRKQNAQFTETNFDNDLTTAIEKVRLAHEAFNKLPNEDRQQFPTPEALWQAYMSGELQKKVDNANWKKNLSDTPVTEKNPDGREPEGNRARQRAQTRTPARAENRPTDESPERD